MSCARVLIEVDITHELKDYIAIRAQKKIRLYNKWNMSGSHHFVQLAKRLGMNAKKRLSKLRSNKSEISKYGWKKRQNKVIQLENTSAIKTHTKNKEDNVALEDDAVKPEWTVV